SRAKAQRRKENPLETRQRFASLRLCARNIFSPPFINRSSSRLRRGRRPQPLCLVSSISLIENSTNLQTSWRDIFADSVLDQSRSSEFAWNAVRRCSWVYWQFSKRAARMFHWTL